MPEKTYKVLIEIPEKWFDADSPIGYASSKIRDEARRMLKEAIIEQYLSKVNPPEIEITREELKAVILDRMADAVFKKKRQEGDFDEF